MTPQLNPLPAAKLKCEVQQQRSTKKGNNSFVLSIPHTSIQAGHMTSPLFTFDARRYSSLTSHKVLFTFLLPYPQFSSSWYRTINPNFFFYLNDSVLYQNYFEPTQAKHYKINRRLKIAWWPLSCPLEYGGQRLDWIGYTSFHWWLPQITNSSEGCPKRTFCRILSVFLNSSLKENEI